RWKTEIGTVSPWTSFVHSVRMDEFAEAALADVPPSVPKPLWDRLADKADGKVVTIGACGGVWQTRTECQATVLDIEACRTSSSNPHCWLFPPRCVHPSSWQAHVEPLRRHPASILSSDLLELVPRADVIDQRVDSRLSLAAQVLAEFETLRTTAGFFADRIEPRYLFIGIDLLARFPGVLSTKKEPKDDPFGPACRARQWQKIRSLVTELKLVLRPDTRVLIIADGPSRFDAASTPAWPIKGTRSPEQLALDLIGEVDPEGAQNTPQIKGRPASEIDLHRRDLEIVTRMQSG
ncbi:MAG: hypothetical protein AAGB34_11100, partial [Planctomycetota bacterium]